MAVSSRKEIRDYAMSVTDTEGSEMESLVNDFINQTLNEINDPGWAYSPKAEVQHNWTWLRRKYSFSTVASTSDYLLPSDVDRISILRQETTPIKLRHVSDRRFYEEDALRDESGNPRVYRIWEISGVSTKLAVADTITVVSSSASDSGNTNLKVTVWGYVDGILRNETITLNGTSSVIGTLTFDADDVFVSKQMSTTGKITVTESSGGTTLVVLAPQDRISLHKIVSLYPIPSAAITMYLEYYTRINELENDSDVPLFDRKWHHIVAKGTIAKIYQHLGEAKINYFQSAVALYRSAVRSMIASDSTVDDYIPTLKRHVNIPNIDMKRSTDAIS